MCTQAMDENKIASSSSEDSDSSDMSFDSDATSSDEEISETPINSQNKTEQVDNNAEDDEEDETIKAFIREQEKKRDHPPDIVLEDHIVDICFHPNEELLAVANITGDVIICKYNNEETSVVDTWELHTKACRDIEFSTNGTMMFSTSKDKAIMVTDVSTGKLKCFYENSHDVPVYSLLVLDENLLASGDDDGRVKLWDLRSNKLESVFQMRKNEDYISDMVTNESQRYLVVSSGDGSITSVDLRNRQFHLQSEEYDEEFTNLGLFRTDTKLLVSTSKGKLFLFNWGEFGYHSDEFPGIKHSINSLVPVTENIVVCATEDGLLRATHLFPHRHLGIVGQHSMPIECVDICNNGQFIASSSHNNDIKFWNIKYFEDFEKINCKEKHSKKDLTNNLPSSKRKNVADFFSDLT